MKRRKKKKAVITFDDGWMDAYMNAYPFLKRYNIPFTVYITGACRSRAQPGCQQHASRSQQHHRYRLPQPVDLLHPGTGAHQQHDD